MKLTIKQLRFAIRETLDELAQHNYSNVVGNQVAFPGVQSTTTKKMKVKKRDQGINTRLPGVHGSAARYYEAEVFEDDMIELEEYRRLKKEMKNENF
jgi:hypothetical protein